MDAVASEISWSKAALATGRPVGLSSPERTQPQEISLATPLGLRLFWIGAVFRLKTNTYKYSLFKCALLQTKNALSGAKIGFGIGSIVVVHPY